MKPAPVMRHTIYLEAPARSQDLLTTKWMLRSCGYVIGSTWHDEPTLAANGGPSHWDCARLEELKRCDTLVVVRGDDRDLPPGLAFLVGFAAARNLRVIWLGVPANLPGGLRTVQFVSTLDEFRKQFQHGSDPLETSTSDDPVAA